MSAMSARALLSTGSASAAPVPSPKRSPGRATAAGPTPRGSLRAPARAIGAPRPCGRARPEQAVRRRERLRGDETVEQDDRAAGRCPKCNADEDRLLEAAEAGERGERLSEARRRSQPALSARPRPSARASRRRCGLPRPQTSSGSAAGAPRRARWPPSCSRCPSLPGRRTPAPSAMSSSESAIPAAMPACAAARLIAGPATALAWCQARAARNGCPDARRARARRRRRRRALRPPPGSGR